MFALRLRVPLSFIFAASLRIARRPGRREALGRAVRHETPRCGRSAAIAASAPWGLLALTFFVLALSPAIARAADADVRGVDRFFSLSTGELKAEAADARAEGKKGLMLFFEQEGCPGCLHMKKHVLNRASVQDYYRHHFVNLAVDIRGAVPLKDFAGRDHTEKSFAQSVKVRGTPTFIFYDLSGNELVRIFGPLETPQEFLLLGEFVTSGAYKTRTFARYKTEQPSRKGH